MTLPATTDKSWLRCPRSTCDQYGKRLELDVGQHESLGDLRVRHWCPDCGYEEHGPSTPTAARRTSTTLRDLLYRQRREGIVLALHYDTTPFPRGEFDDEPADA